MPAAEKPPEAGFGAVRRSSTALKALSGAPKQHHSACDPTSQTLKRAELTR
jgi:hypothetical protein